MPAAPTGTLALADAVADGTHGSTFGDLDVDGTLSTVGSWLSLAGTVVVDGQITNPNFASDVKLESGTLSGTGTIVPSFQAVSGTVAPGGIGTVGTLTFGDVYSQTPAATPALDLASDSSYDRLWPVNNNAFFDGAVTVNVLGGYAPAVGTTWDVVANSPGIQNLGWTVTPSVFLLLTVSHGAQLSLTAPLPAPVDPGSGGGAAGTPPPPPAGGGGDPAPPAALPPAALPLAAPPLATPPAPAAPAPDAAARRRLLLGCSGRRLVLNDVLQRGGRVSLSGAAAQDLAGQKVKILFDDRTPVATATVGADGRFTATAPLPAARLRTTNGARYLAAIGTQKSLDLKLTRRLVLAPPRASHGSVVLTGQVVAPLAKPIASVSILQQTACGTSVVVQRFTPPASGHFTITLPAPTGAPAAIHRLSTEVRRTPTNPKSYATYSLPLPVLLG